LRNLHARLAAFPTIQSQDFPTIALIGFVPASDCAVVKIEKLGNLLTKLAIIKLKIAFLRRAIP
jgi:hypothetical protein